MAYQLSTRAKQLLDQTNIEPNIVMCIDGLEMCFGVTISYVGVRIGAPGLTIGGGWVIGGLTKSEKVLDYISLSGTTTNITQQLDLDKTAATSTQTMKVRVVDFNGEITRLISPGFDLNDVLYKNVTVYLGFKDGDFPNDYVDLFIGKISMVESGSGFVEFTISHPEDLKRSEIFPRIETTLVTQADYYSKVIQDLTYYQQGNLQGVASVTYYSTPFVGDIATVSTAGNTILVGIDLAATKAKTIKAAIENHIDASKIALPLISGNPEAFQVVHTNTLLTVSDTVEVQDVTGCLLPYGTIFKTYLRINDEIMEYTGIDPVTNTFTGVTRRALKSFGKTHEVDDAVSTFYKLGDNTNDSNAIDLALKVMLSGGEDYYYSNVTNLKFYNFGTVDNYTNGFLITGVNALRLHNIQVGDFCTVEDAVNPANNFVDGVVERIELIDLGTIIYITGQSFVIESGSPAKAKFLSQYNILPDGCQYIPNQVDIARFKEVQTQFPSSIANYEIYLKDTANAKDLINTDIFLPSALYSIPRSGKASLGISAPPLYNGGSKVLSFETLKNPSALKTSRSISKYFYNAIVFKYNDDSIDDRQLSGSIIYSANSQNRISAPNKPYTIKAGGIRPSAANDQLIERNSKRLLQRYQFAAEVIPVEPDYKTGFQIEVGDAVVFGDEKLQVSDTINGTREYKPRVFEVVNKDFDWKTGKIKLSIVDTNYSAGVRYGVWAPSSFIGTGSTTSRVLITESFGSSDENLKWTPYIGKSIRVRNEDYTFDEKVKFVSFDVVNDHIMIVSPALSVAPTSGMIIDVPDYDDLNANADAFYKAVHPFWNPTCEVTSGVNGSSFNVSLGDAAILFEGAILRIHNDDFTVDSVDKLIKIDTIVGTLVTTSAIGFTPAAGYKIDLIGFVSDNGAPYCWV